MGAGLSAERGSEEAGTGEEEEEVEGCCCCSSLLPLLSAPPRSLFSSGRAQGLSGAVDQSSASSLPASSPSPSLSAREKASEKNEAARGERQAATVGSRLLFSVSNDDDEVLPPPKPPPLSLAPPCSLRLLSKTSAPASAAGASLRSSP